MGAACGTFAQDQRSTPQGKKHTTLEFVSGLPSLPSPFYYDNAAATLDDAIKRTAHFGSTVFDDLEEEPPARTPAAASSSTAEGHHTGLQTPHFEALMKELFHLHGILDEAELFQALRAIARQQGCSRLCRETLRTKYRDVFQTWIDSSGRPAPYKIFSKLMLEVLREFDSDEDVQADVMWAFICTLRNGYIACMRSAGHRKHAQLLGPCTEVEMAIADLIRELFDIQDLNGNGELEESEVIQLNKKIAQLHHGQHADLEAVTVKFKAVFREGLSPRGMGVPFSTFQVYMQRVLNENDTDPYAQFLVIEQLVLEARTARESFDHESLACDGDEQYRALFRGDQVLEEASESLSAGGEEQEEEARHAGSASTKSYSFIENESTGCLACESSECSCTAGQESSSSEVPHFGAKRSTSRENSIADETNLFG